jgi:hypothetical protein
LIGAVLNVRAVEKGLEAADATIGQTLSSLADVPKVLLEPENV